MKGHLIWAQLQGREKELAELREKVEARQREIDKNDQVLDKVRRPDHSTAFAGRLAPNPSATHRLIVV